jgi:hypothetical protein
VASLFKVLFVLQYLPKITLFYVLFSLLNGMSLNNIVLAITLIFDVLDWIPVD